MTKKSIWMVKTLDWIGEETRTTENGITMYSPGTKLVWQDLKAFNSPGAADEWLCEYLRRTRYPVEHYTIVKQ